MPEGEGGPEIPKSTPEQGPKAEKEITEERLPQITWPEMHDLIQPGPEGGQVISNPWLTRLAKLLSIASPSRLTPESLHHWLDQGDEKYVAGELPEEEWGVTAGAIQKKIDELLVKKAEAEPEIKRLERPKSPEEAVRVFLEELFVLHERGLRENKGWEKTGELWSEFTTLQRWVEDINSEWGDEFRDKELHPDSINHRLEEFLARQYPEIRLREKLSLLLEAMKRLHNRQIEVVRTEGGLEDLGVGKVGEAAAPILKVPFTNIRPVDWYILTHPDELFPESPNPETKINLETAWSLWQEIGKNPHGFFKFKFKNGLDHKKEDEELQKITDNRNINQEEKIEQLLKKREKFFNDGKGEWELQFEKEDIEKAIKEGTGKWDLLRWDLDEFKPIEVLDKKGWDENFTLKDLFQSERVMAEVRAKIARAVGNKIASQTAGARAENLAHSILTVGLTFDMWDRERWKQKGKQEARDLMWFDWKRIERFLQLRPAGPADTVGCYWASEEKLKKAPKNLEEMVKGKRLSPAEAKRRLDYLKKNKEKAVFFVRSGKPAEGTIIGDFFTSTFYKDNQEKNHRLSDESLKGIPWLDPGRFEEESYEGYFTYSMMFAAMMDNYISKLEWKPEELKNRDFWVRLTDVTLRLEHFCPWLIARTRTHDDKPIRNEEERRADAAWFVLKFRGILARGILWTGSYLAQPHPEKLFTSGTFSEADVYGDSFLRIKFGPGILDAIESSGYLNEENIKELRKEIWDFNFYIRGRK